MARATKHVDPTLVSTPAQRWMRKKREAEKQARHYEKQGQMFMAQLARRDAELYGAHYRRAKGLPPTDTDPVALFRGQFV